MGDLQTTCRSALAKYVASFVSSILLAPPRVVGIFGPNGAGKTTLLKLLSRQILPQSGSIEILGQTFEKNEKGLKNLIGYVPQDPIF